MNEHLDAIPEDPPTPVDAGNAGTQALTPAEQPMPVAISPMPSSVADMTWSIASVRPRSLGHDAAAQMLSSYMRELENRREKAHQDMLDERKLHDTTRGQLTTTAIENAKLRTQVKGEHAFRTVRGICGLVGALLVGIGVDLFKSGEATRGYGILVGIVGLVLAMVSWFPLFKNGSEE